MATEGPSWADQWGAGGIGAMEDENTKSNREVGNNKNAGSTAGLGKAKAAAILGAQKVKNGTSIGINQHKPEECCGNSVKACQCCCKKQRSKRRISPRKNKSAVSFIKDTRRIFKGTIQVYNALLLKTSVIKVKGSQRLLVGARVGEEANDHWLQELEKQHILSDEDEAEETEEAYAWGGEDFGLWGGLDLIGGGFVQTGRFQMCFLPATFIDRLCSKV
ncbi:unnamed protein product [Fraxinus pennsylvanica]|uniref:Uncharacterized protein n=1 Tax=Fraxinus pennsylvanica TaxID=56036 RepID=A0AAD2A9B9_9LAMI|nr:unnamed protein product [Fraxinus pennsylvanica]